MMDEQEQRVQTNNDEPDTFNYHMSELIRLAWTEPIIEPLLEVLTKLIKRINLFFVSDK